MSPGNLNHTFETGKVLTDKMKTETQRGRPRINVVATLFDIFYLEAWQGFRMVLCFTRVLGLQGFPKLAASSHSPASSCLRIRSWRSRIRSSNQDLLVFAIWGCKVLCVQVCHIISFHIASHHNPILQHRTSCHIVSRIFVPAYTSTCTWS